MIVSLVWAVIEPACRSFFLQRSPPAFDCFACLFCGGGTVRENHWLVVLDLQSAKVMAINHCTTFLFPHSYLITWLLPVVAKSISFFLMPSFLTWDPRVHFYAFSDAIHANSWRSQTVQNDKIHANSWRSQTVQNSAKSESQCLCQIALTQNRRRPLPLVKSALYERERSTTFGESLSRRSRSQLRLWHLLWSYHSEAGDPRPTIPNHKVRAEIVALFQVTLTGQGGAIEGFERSASQICRL